MFRFLHLPQWIVTTLLVASLTASSRVSANLVSAPASSPRRALAASAAFEPVGQVGGQGFDVMVQGRYAYVGEGNTLSIYDISTPAAPQRLGYALMPEKAIGVYVAGDYAYVSATDYLAVVSLADKTQPRLVGQAPMRDPAYTYAGQMVTVAGSYAYVAVWESNCAPMSCSGGLMTFSVADPANPQCTDTLRLNRGRSVFSGNGQLYLITDNGLHVLTLADPAHPALTGTYTPSNIAKDVHVVGQYAYVAGFSNLIVVDVSNPVAPAEVSQTGTSLYPSGVFVADGYLYAAAGDRLHIYSLAQPTQPVEVSLLYVAPDSFGAALHTALYVTGTTAYVMADVLGLCTVSVSDKAHPAVLSDGGLTQAEAIQLNGAYAYVLDGDRRLSIVSLADPAQPTVLTRWDNRRVSGLHVLGQYGYAWSCERYGAMSCGDDWGFTIYSLANPAQPVETGRAIYTGGWLSEIFAAGNYAYALKAGYHTLLTYDITNKAAPSLVDETVYPPANSSTAPPNDLWVAGGYLYVAWRAEGVRIFSLANPAKPQLVGAYDTPGDALGLYAANGYLYVADYTSLLILSPATPGQLTLVGTLALPDGQVENVAVAGKYAYVADGGRGLYLASMANPAYPVVVGTAYDPGVAADVADGGASVYLADRMGGFFTLAPQLPADISGKVLTGEGAPLPGAVVQTNAGYSATTSADGAYTLPALPAGVYTLTVTTPGYFWQPAERVVRLPPNATGQNFSGATLYKQSGLPANQLATYGTRITYTVGLFYSLVSQEAFYDAVPTYSTYLSDSLLAPAGMVYSPTLNAITGWLPLTGAVPLTVTFSVQVNLTGTAEFGPALVNRACVYAVAAGQTACRWSAPVINYTYRQFAYLPFLTR